MKVLNLRCANGHGFEGWFGSEDEFLDQNGRAALECPMCADQVITRLPSAPRLNLAGSGSAERPATAANPQAQWLKTVRQVLAQTEDVGDRFATEARRIHYGEIAARGIRGRATEEERESLSDEGIEVASIPMPAAFKGTVQ